MILPGALVERVVLGATRLHRIHHVMLVQLYTSHSPNIAGQSRVSPSTANCRGAGQNWKHPALLVHTAANSAAVLGGVPYRTGVEQLPRRPVGPEVEVGFLGQESTSHISAKTIGGGFRGK